MHWRKEETAKDRQHEGDPGEMPAWQAISYGSNCVWLSHREWLATAGLLVVLMLLVPVLWQRLEKLEPDADYRLPSALSDDYCLFARYCRWACRRDKILVLGDSAIRGYYVPKDGTLSHHLNAMVGGDGFANMGVDGMHPAALFGLLKYYGKDIAHKEVILHLNPLWMSSPKSDLRTSKESRFHHPGLVPQFVPRIACYKDSLSSRISTVVERSAGFFAWTSHIKQAYFDHMDIPAWTLEHPYNNPLQAVTLVLPQPQEPNRSEQVSWLQKGLSQESLEWVDADTSLQWEFFRRTVAVLKARHNDVFVLVGPFNEHIMEATSMAAYSRLKGRIESYLNQDGVAYYIPPPLPSGLYRDASHLLPDGYAMLARELLTDESFRAFLHRSAASAE